MSVTVTTATNAEILGSGADFDFEDGGILVVVDGQGGNVAAYRPDIWQSVQVAEP